MVGAVIPVALLGGAMVVWKRPTPAGIVGLYVIAAGLGTAFTLFLFLQKFEIWWMLRPSLSLVRPILLAGCGPWIAIFSNVLIGFGVQTLIAAHFPSAELGRYGVVSSLSAWVSGVGLAVTIPAVSDWSRLAAARDFAALRKDFRLRQASTAAFLGAAAVLVALGAEPILRLLYGAEFAPASPLLRIFAMNWLVNGLGGWYWYCLFAIGHPWRVAPPNLAAAIPSILFTYASIHFTGLGVMGAALAIVFGSVCWLVTYEFNFRAAMRGETPPSAQ
jgi:O-antigen/teichoic acid export membrane protein